MDKTEYYSKPLDKELKKKIAAFVDTVISI
jgi:hypothetical protein